MTEKKRSNPISGQFVDETLNLIEEKGGSHDVNLREVSRRVGCAHTNAYNYFGSFEGLLWASYRKAIRIYDEYLTNNLDISDSDFSSLSLLIERLAKFPMDHPGLYRFIGSDPLAIENMPPDVIEAISELKERFIQGIMKLNNPVMSHSDAADIASIIIAYISGESFDVINGRVLPEEDLPGRIVRNALRLYGCLSSGVVDKQSTVPEERKQS